MKILNYAFLAVFFLAPLSSVAQTLSPQVDVRYLEPTKRPTFCENDETIVFFVNGLNNILDDAVDDADALKSRLLKRLDGDLFAQSAFNKLVVGSAFAHSVLKEYWQGRLTFVADLTGLAIPDLERLNTAQIAQWALEISTLPEHERKELESRLVTLKQQAVTNSPADLHATEYNRLIDIGRSVMLSSHSWGTMTSNISYFPVDDANNELSFGILPVALMDNRVEGAKDAKNLTPTFYSKFLNEIKDDEDENTKNFYTNTQEDAVAVYPLFLNKPWNVDNNPVQFVPKQKNHGYAKFYLKDGTAAEYKIMEDLVNVRQQLKSEPCHGIGFSANGTKYRVASNEFGPHESIETKSMDYPQPELTQRLVDWKGRYRGTLVDRYATRTLSWIGPSARYNGPWVKSKDIYRDGRVAYVAPFPVLGAAIQEDSNGIEWIVAIVEPSPNTIQVFRRPAAYIDQRMAIVNPDFAGVFDWQLLMPPLNEDQFAQFDSKTYSPWFFNGDGTEARTLRVETRSMDFDAQPTSDSCANITDPGCGHDAGAFPIKAMIEYKLSVAADSVNWVFDRLPLQFGDTGVLAVDYIDQYPVYMKSVNPISYGPRSPGDIGDVDSSYTKWVDIISTEPGVPAYPLASLDLLDCKRELWICRGVDRLFLSDDSAAGFSTSWMYRPVIDSVGVQTRVDLQVQWADIRTGTFFVARSDRSLDVSIFGDMVKPKYYVIHKGVEKQVGVAAAEAPIVFGTGYGVSRYGFEAAVAFRPPAVLITLVDPILGQYERRPNVASELPVPNNFDIVVNIDGDVLLTAQFEPGTFINFSNNDRLLLSLSSVLTNSQSIAPLSVLTNSQSIAPLIAR